MADEELSVEQDAIPPAGVGEGLTQLLFRLVSITLLA